MLKLSLIKEGCRDPLVIWKNEEKNIIVDGHNRYKICTAEEIEFDVVYREFDNISEVKSWMIDNQLGRRNLNPEQSSYYRGLKYLQTRKKKGGYDKVIQKEKGEPTSTVLAREFKVSKATVERDARFAASVEIIGKSNPELRAQILLGDVKVKKGDIVHLRKQPDIKIKNERDLHNKILRLKNKKPFESNASVDNLPTELDLNSLFASHDEKLKTMKARIVSLMNIALRDSDLKSFEKASELLDQMMALVKAKNSK